MVVERERRWRAEVEWKGRRDTAGAKLETENADLAKSLATSQWNLEVENGLVVCSTWYWVLNLLQLPFAFGVFGYECCKLYKESRDRKNAGNSESVCEASIEWSAPNLALCALCGISGGTVGGLLGSGGGFILGPLLLEIGVIPEVASVIVTFVMMFSASLSVVEFYLLDRFAIHYVGNVSGLDI